MVALELLILYSYIILHFALSSMLSSTDMAHALFRDSHTLWQPTHLRGRVSSTLQPKFLFCKQARDQLQRVDSRYLLPGANH